MDFLGRAARHIHAAAWASRSERFRRSRTDRLWAAISSFIGVLVVGVLLVGIMLGATPHVYAGSLSDREYAMKAAFLYNFANFIEWPESTFRDSDTPLIVGIFGEDPFGHHLDALKGRRVKGRTLEIKHFTRTEDIIACHILFVSSQQQKHIARVCETLQDAPVLTVSNELEELIQSGCIINFVIVKNKLRFEINSASAERAGLDISSQLLSVATVINPTRE